MNPLLFRIEVVVWEIRYSWQMLRLRQGSRIRHDATRGLILGVRDDSSILRNRDTFPDAEILSPLQQANEHRISSFRNRVARICELNSGCRSDSIKVPRGEFLAKFRHPIHLELERTVVPKYGNELNTKQLEPNKCK